MQGSPRSLVRLFWRDRHTTEYISTGPAACLGVLGPRTPNHCVRGLTIPRLTGACRPESAIAVAGRCVRGVCYNLQSNTPWSPLHYHVTGLENSPPSSPAALEHPMAFSQQALNLEPSMLRHYPPGPYPRLMDAILRRRRGVPSLEGGRVRRLRARSSKSPLYGGPQYIRSYDGQESPVERSTCRTASPRSHPLPSASLGGQETLGSRSSFHARRKDPRPREATGELQDRTPGIYVLGGVCHRRFH